MKDIVKRIILFLAAWTGWRKTVHLVPLSQLESREGKWISTGEDPAFLLSGWFKRGWCELSWYSESEDYIPLKCYWDNGKGFNENQSFVLGEIPRGKMHYSKTVFIPKDAYHIRLDPGEKVQTFVLTDMKIKSINKLAMAYQSVMGFIKQRGFSLTTLGNLVRKGLEIWKSGGASAVWQRIKRNSGLDAHFSVIDYPLWVKDSVACYEDRASIQKTIAEWDYKPLISVIVPVYNVDEIWLRKCLDSVLNQHYTHWELCIADDASTKPHIKPLLQAYARKDQRIKLVFCKENGHISRSSNAALEIAAGEYIALLDHDDELAPEALYENVSLLNKHRDADVIYSDEDKISVKGERYDPFFKPDWLPDLLTSQMYTCHLTLYRKSLVEEAGGFRVGYEGSQDFDLMLRVSELTGNIYHIPKILYHWRTIPTSTASSSGSKDYTQDAGRRALEDAIRRRNLSARVEAVEGCSNTYNLKYTLEKEPKVSILIPTRNMASTLEVCLDSIFAKTRYDNFEVIIIDNGSDEQELFALLDHWKQREPDRFKVCPLHIPFNYSRLNNEAAAQAEGELLLLLNNDIEVISENWLYDMAAQAVRPEIGAVGSRLLYPDGTLQHAGVVLGIGGVAGHSHKHFASNHPGYFNRLLIASNYTAVTAACLMVRKSLYEEVGGLEEGLQVAFNDVDFCLKLWAAGYNNIWLPDVKLYHHESKSRGHEDTPEKQERFRGECEFIQAKWGPLLENDPAYNPNLTYIREDFSMEHFKERDYRNNQGVYLYPRKPMAPKAGTDILTRGELAQ